MIDRIDAMGFAELHEAYSKADDYKIARGIIRRTAQLIAELDSDYNPESGELEPDHIGAAKDFLNGEDPNRY